VKEMLYNMVKFFERLAVRIKFLDVFYSAFGKCLVEKEISAASIIANDKVLHIGCGSFPYTAIIISQMSGAAVTAIDCDSIAVKDAKYYIKRKHIPWVKIEKADGVNYPLTEFDVIVVSHGVKPKETVLKIILQSMKSGARLIYRNPKGFVGYLYNNEEFVFLEKAERIGQEKITCRESILVKKG
jgi:protein-L-isoaspartate O-methyltransferase